MRHARRCFRRLLQLVPHVILQTVHHGIAAQAEVCRSCSHVNLDDKKHAVCQHAATLTAVAAWPWLDVLSAHIACDMVSRRHASVSVRLHSLLVCAQARMHVVHACCTRILTGRLSLPVRTMQRRHSRLLGARMRGCCYSGWPRLALGAICIHASLAAANPGTYTMTSGILIQAVAASDEPNSTGGGNPTSTLACAPSLPRALLLLSRRSCWYLAVSTWQNFGHTPRPCWLHSTA